ncbi:MAG: four helix bundle protein [Leeuwenhoekiella sp.]
MGKIDRFEDLEVWQLAREVCLDINRLIDTSQLATDYALRNQINRSSGSVMDNIAEGFERDGSKEFKQYLSISKGSCGEVRSQLYRCLDRNYLSQDEFSKISNKTVVLSKKLGSFISYLKNTNFKGVKFK